jgi:hypothetical protein
MLGELILVSLPPGVPTPSLGLMNICKVDYKIDVILEPNHHVA